MDSKEYWASKVWVLVFVWPFMSYKWTLEFLKFENTQTIFAQIGLIIGWLVCFYGFYILVQIANKK